MSHIASTYMPCPFEKKKKKKPFHNGFGRCLLQCFAIVSFSCHAFNLPLAEAQFVKDDIINSAMKSYNSIYDWNSLQLLVPWMPKKEELVVASKKTLKYLWTSEKELTSTKGFLLQLFLQQDNVTQSTPVVCSTLRSLMFQNAPLDQIYYAILSNGFLSCNQYIPNSITHSLMSHIEVALQLDPLSQEKMLADGKVSSSAFDMSSKNVFALPAWVGVYKAVAVLETFENSQQWKEKKQLFKQRLQEVLKATLLDETENYDAFLILEMADLFFSLTLRESRDNSIVTQDILKAIQVWWSRHPKITQSNHLDSSLHMLAIDIMIRHITNYTTHAPFLPWIINSIRQSTQLFDSPVVEKTSFQQVEDILLLLSFSNASLQKTLLPLLPQSLAFHVATSEAVLGVCRTSSDNTNDIDIYHHAVCLKLFYCPLLDNTAKKNSVNSLTSILFPDLSVLLKKGARFETVSLSPWKSSVPLYVTCDAFNRSAQYPTCQDIGTYHLPHDLSQSIIHGVLIEKQYSRPFTPPSVALMTLNYLRVHSSLMKTLIFPENLLNSSVEIREPRQDQPFDLSQDISLDMETTTSLSVIISLKNDQGKLLSKEQPSFEKNLTIGTLETEFKPELVAVFLEVLNRSKHPVIFSTTEEALAHSPHGASSSRTLFGVIQNTNEGIAYVVTLDMTELSKELYLFPSSTFRLSALIVGDFLPDPLRILIGNVKLDSTDPDEFIWNQKHNVSLIQFSDKQYYTVLPSEAFWFPKFILRHQFPVENKNVLYRSWISLTFVLLVLCLSSSTIRFIPLLGLKMELKHLVLRQYCFLAYLGFMTSLLLWYWTCLTFRFFLKIFCVSTLLGTVLIYLTIPQFFL